MADLKIHAGLPWCIRRSHIYDDVIKIYTENKDQILDEYPFCVRFDGENAVDTGGVCRDMYSSFWESAFFRHFDGENLLIPAVNPSTKMTTLQLLGIILAHGYMVVGYLPIRVAFPVLATILCSPTEEFTDSVLVQSFIDYISLHEGSVLHSAAKGGKFLTNEVISVLSRLGCTEIPTRHNIKELILKVAKHQLLIKPLAAIYSMRAGVPNLYKEFWERFSVSRFYNLYRSLQATPGVVMGALSEPAGMNAAETRVFNYLRSYVGNMSQGKLSLFLRFVTGSPVMTANNISVQFNNLSGFARRPISHTCDYTLELSMAYDTYIEFAKEFTSVLSNEDLCWYMDAI